MSNSLALHGGIPVRTAPFSKWPVYGQPEEQALLRALHSGKWGKIDGSEVRNFEKSWADYCDTKYAIGVCNGTISLRIALMAAGIAAGDEVIIPPYTFLATATAVIEANATPVFVDIDRETFNIDPALIEAAITPRTKAIMPVHLGGLPCDMDAIMAIAKKHNLFVIEDAAHAHGSIYKGRKVGSLGHMASFSFQSSKNLTSGEGGALTTNDKLFNERIHSIHNCGRVPGGQWYEHHVIAGNYRLGEFAGAVLNCQFERLDEQNRRRDENGKYLDAKLSEIPGLSPQKRDADATLNAYHLYPIRYDESVYGVPRGAWLKALAAEGVPVSPGYVVPLYKQPVFTNAAFGPFTASIDQRPNLDFGAMHLPVCEQICSGEGSWIYQNVLLGTRADMDDVVSAFEKVYENRESLAESGKAVAMAK